MKFSGGDGDWGLREDPEVKNMMKFKFSYIYSFGHVRLPRRLSLYPTRASGLSWWSGLS